MKRAELMQRARTVLQTTAHYYGLHPSNKCRRCGSREADSDILTGHCQLCTTALVGKARSKLTDSSPLFAPLERKF